MKCSQTNTPAHKNEADQFQSQKRFSGMYWTVWPSATKIEEKNIKTYKKEMKNDSLTIFAFRGTYWTEWPFTKKSIKKIDIKYL